MKELYDLTVKEASEKLENKEITSLELTKACLSRIQDVEPEINAFINTYPEKAIESAKEADKRVTQGERISQLDGIPYSLKDVYVTKGIETTAGSKILKGYIPEYDATVYKKLSKAGAVFVGKTNCDPFGFGSSTENSSFGITKNPVNQDYVPGGSSGGSGAAVRYGGGLFSIAEDTGGSIRCPASFCGVVGLKPTYGRVSRYGAIAYASSYDSVGPIGKTPYDCAMILEEIAGYDEKDATSSEIKVNRYTDGAHNDKVVAGLPKEYFTDDIDSEVKCLINDAIERLKEMNIEFKEISLPYTKYAIAAYYLIGLSEASSNLARLDGLRYGYYADGMGWEEKIRKARGEAFCDEAKRRIMLGTFALSAGYKDQYYSKAQKIRKLLRKDFNRVFKKVDVIITPTMPVLPFKIGEKSKDPLQMWLADAFTVTVNPVGLPAMSINAGYSEQGLPVGMQIIGSHFDEETLINVSNRYYTDGV
jgi:aspartyl-tRNA(Asn)/glutamyl-tRNA(Gln) amidotransferase subunit A